MKPFTLSLLLGALAVSARAQSTPRTFTGTITDSECATANHSLMRMGDTDAECVRACVDAHGATYLLFDGTTSYQLSDQKTPASFAGATVIVSGTLDETTHTIAVTSIAAAR